MENHIITAMTIEIPLAEIIHYYPPFNEWHIRKRITIFVFLLLTIPFGGAKTTHNTGSINKLFKYVFIPPEAGGP